MQVAVSEGTLSKDKYKKVLKKLKVRRARIVKISKATFTKKIEELKKKVEEKKISVTKYRSIVYAYRSHMTISISSYQTRIKWLTSQWKLGKISMKDYSSRKKLL